MDKWQERRSKQEPRINDVRSSSDRDLSRLIHSSAFRRLQSKTQVLGLGESDFYRTRLTHSMEVAQIGRGIVDKLKKQEKNNELLPDRSQIECICLAHDIGHPPFGHGGEVALNACMLKHGGFEGNGQTLRILSLLDKYKSGYGLNPSRRTLLGVLKYPVAYSQAINRAISPLENNSSNWLIKADDFKPPKCYFDEDEEIVDWILLPLSSSDKKQFTTVDRSYTKKHGKTIYKSLDTTIMDIADDISYGVHDLEDGISLGMITKELWDDAFANKTVVWVGLDLDRETIRTELFSVDSCERKKAIGSLVNTFITKTKLVSWSDYEFEEQILNNKAVLEEEARNLLDILQSIVVRNMIENDNVQQLEFKGQKIVANLFEVFLCDPKRLLPKRTFEIFNRNNGGPRVICDYISGMTDDYAIRQYEKIFVPKKGSVFERV